LNFHYDGQDENAPKGILTFEGVNSPYNMAYLPQNMSHVSFLGATGCTTASGNTNLITVAKDRGCKGLLGFASSPESGWCDRYTWLFWHYALDAYNSGNSLVHGAFHKISAHAAVVQLYNEEKPNNPTNPNSMDWYRGFQSPRTFNTDVKLVTNDPHELVWQGAYVPATNVPKQAIRPHTWAQGPAVPAQPWPTNNSLQ
jgi:hypothetical protein